VKFLLDQDVPVEIGRVLAHSGHEIVFTRDVLTDSASDNQVFADAVEHGLLPFAPGCLPAHSSANDSEH
jgi:predicted nuclease of predicted toxin-antitoxin system